jgi:GNAT superfamily N-acetyltransferase
VTLRARRAREEDFERVTELLEILGRDVVTPETAAECQRVFEAQVVGQESAPLVVEDDSGRVIACCSLHYRPRLNRPRPDAWIPDLVVDPGARRQGAGRALLEEAERLARNRGCWQLTLESGYRREDAHRMYAAFGMANEGYYFGKPLD